jgi:hypothetical protein
VQRIRDTIEFPCAIRIAAEPNWRCRSNVSFRKSNLPISRRAKTGINCNDEGYHDRQLQHGLHSGIPFRRADSQTLTTVTILTDLTPGWVALCRVRPVISVHIPSATHQPVTNHSARLPAHTPSVTSSFSPAAFSTDWSHSARCDPPQPTPVASRRLVLYTLIPNTFLSKVPLRLEL